MEILGDDQDGEDQPDSQTHKRYASPYLSAAITLAPTPIHRHILSYLRSPNLVVSKTRSPQNG
jgi:hypothetical protein